MAIKGKTILLRPAYCKQAERKVERARDAVWRGAENEESSKKWRRGRRGDGHSADDEARVRKLFHLGGKVLFKCLKKHNQILIIKWMFTKKCCQLSVLYHITSTNI